jgi:hypothetical protein
VIYVLCRSRTVATTYLALERNINPRDAVIITSVEESQGQRPTESDETVILGADIGIIDIARRWRWTD